MAEITLPDYLPESLHDVVRHEMERLLPHRIPRIITESLAMAILARLAKHAYDQGQRDAGMDAPTGEAMLPAAFVQRRNALDISQSMLAEYLGVHVRTISKWERGINPIPRHIALALDRLDQLAALGKAVAE